MTMKVFTYLCLLMAAAFTVAAKANTDLSLRHAKQPRLKEGKIDERLVLVKNCNDVGTSASSSLQLLRRIPRGGAWCPTALPPATAAYLGAQGMLEIANPNMFVTKILDNNNNKEFPSSSLSSAACALTTTDSVLIRAVGSMTTGTAITLYCSSFLQPNISTQMAIGLGLLPRLIYFIVFIWKFRKTKVMIITTAMTLVCTSSLLIGTDTAELSFKLFSTFAFAKGLVMVLVPKKAVEKILEEEVNDEQTLALTRVLGNEAVVSGVLMSALSYGVELPTAMGFALLSYPLLIGDEVFRRKTWNVYESRFNGERVNIVVRTILAAVSFLSMS